MTATTPSPKAPPANQTIDGGAGDDIIRVVTLIGGDEWRGGTGSDTIDWSGVVNEDGATFDLALQLAVSSNGLAMTR